MTRLRRNPHRATSELKRLARPSAFDGFNRLGHEFHPIRELHIKHGELRRHIAVGDDDLQPPTADVVQHRQVFGKAQRIVKRNDDSPQPNAHLGSASRNSRPHSHQRRKIAVVCPVMLGNRDPAEAQRLSPLALLQCSLVKISRPHRANARRTPKVITNFKVWHLFLLTRVVVIDWLQMDKICRSQKI